MLKGKLSSAARAPSWKLCSSMELIRACGGRERDWKESLAKTSKSSRDELFSVLPTSIHTVTAGGSFLADKDAC